VVENPILPDSLRDAWRISFSGAGSGQFGCGFYHFHVSWQNPLLEKKVAEKKPKLAAWQNFTWRREHWISVE